MLQRIITLLIIAFLLSNCGQRTENKTMTIEHTFEEWLENINQTETVDNSIEGFNFGLIETTNGFEMYLIGSKTFDKDDEDWATNVDFEPKQKYFHFGKEFSKDKDWQDILKISEKLILNYVSSNNFKTSIIANAKGITTGFDDGNLTLIKAND